MEKNKSYAVGYCLRNDMVILSDGSHAEMKDWLDEDFERVIQTGPEVPRDARWLAYEYHGHLCCTDVHWIRDISLH